ncbi:NUDIX hydrolase [Acuticoccus sp.]|uniref:NUDIX hydrolase n=1 Tax=Acuticoccus sp. TaxID=1904378 RepID=UPI003B520406
MAAPAADDARADLRIHAPDLKRPDVAELLKRAATLRPPEGVLPADAPVFGDHLLNPHLAAPRDEPPPREAAVLVALGDGADGELCVVLTQRAAHLSAHAGQVALPGGKIEPGETPSAAAVREAHEEVALPPAALRVLGLTDPYLTRTGYFIVPVIALVTRPVVLRPEPGEVADAFVAPWHRVMDAAHRRELVIDRDGAPRRFYETMVGERRVWGVTAGIFKLVSERLYEQ